MPIRQGCKLASRASTWPRDHFCRNTMLPRRSWPARWNEFLPISMPITAISLLSFSDMACSFVFSAPCQLRLLQGPEHGRTIPLPLARPRKRNADTCGRFKDQFSKEKIIRIAGGLEKLAQQAEERSQGSR